MSSTRVDLPDPDTPVTQVKVPRGNWASIAFRLCSSAPRTVSDRPSPLRRFFGTGMAWRPER